MVSFLGHGGGGGEGGEEEDSNRPCSNYKGVEQKLMLAMCKGGIKMTRCSTTMCKNLCLTSKKT